MRVLKTYLSWMNKQACLVNKRTDVIYGRNKFSSSHLVKESMMYLRMETVFTQTVKKIVLSCVFSS